MEELRSLVRKLFWLFLTVFLLITVVFLGLFKGAQEAPQTYESPPMAEPDAWQPKNAQEAMASMDETVKLGYLLIKETPVQMGPSADDPEMRFSGNHLACANCHLKEGAQAGSASWVGVIERFPQFGGRANKIGTIEDRINGCMERSMNGKKLPPDSEPMQAIVAYMKWLGEGLPKNRQKEFTGYAEIKIPDRAVDLPKGEAVYVRECMVCHGKGGQGVSLAEASQGYLYPPLWGLDSYNNGAGMHRVITAAEFIKGNMPFGQATWDRPKLTDEEAFDVAGYINSFERPVKEGTENDYPDKKLKPVSTPYGPWADDFSAEQHKYGPFSPIMDFYKRRYAITKTK